MPESKRGRPVGSGKREDRELLHRMADLLVRDSGLSRTGAAKKVVPEWTDHVVRRLLRKWNAQAETLLAQARARRDAPVEAASPPQSRLLNLAVLSALTARARAQAAPLSATIKALHANYPGLSTAARLSAEFNNLPIVRLRREMEQMSIFQYQRALRERGLR